MSTTSKLTAAFQDGKDAARSSKRSISSGLRHKGQARHFFDSAYYAEIKIVKAERAAEMLTPEYKARVAEDQKRLRLLTKALHNIAAGDFEAAHKNMDVASGFNWKTL
jgi:hypothetical protein